MTLTRRVVFAVTTVAVMAMAGPAMADIKFGVAAEPYPPFTSKDASGKWTGWEIDVMDALCAEIKETCQVADVAWDGIIPALQAKQFDVIWSSMSISAERRQVIDFSTAYYNTTAVIIGAKTGDTDITPEHLKGKVIGVQVSTVHEKYLQKYFGAVSEIKTYATQDEANSDLAAGRIDYVQASGSALDAFLASDQGKACCELKGQVPGDPDILGEGVGAGLRKDDTALKDKINAGIAALAKSGKFKEITARYPGLAGKITVPE